LREEQTESVVSRRAVALPEHVHPGQVFRANDADSGLRCGDSFLRGPNGWIILKREVDRFFESNVLFCAPVA
jgi:hypothetical protein